MVILVAQGDHDAALGVPKIATEIREEYSRDGVIAMQRSSDIVQPVALVIESEEDPFLENYADYLEMTVGEQLMLRLPLSVLRAISTDYRRVRNRHILGLDWKAFFPYIPMIRLSYHEVKFKLQSRREFSLINRCIYLYTGQRQAFAHLEETKDHTQGISCSELFLPAEPTAGFDFRFDTHSPTKGLLIETSDACDLTEFRLILNGHIVIDLTEITTAFVMRRLSPKCVYIPFDLRAPMLSREPSSFAGAINFSRIDEARLQLQFANPQAHIRVCGFVYNQLRTRRGMAGLRFETTTGIILRRWEVPAAVAPASFNTSDPVPRPLEEGRSLCAITHDELAVGDVYVRCAGCGHCFRQEALVNWFRGRAGTARTCVMCRMAWSDWTVYRVTERG
ncbi:E3 ubiquitin-protein ligase [bacterium]|nr:E3 ubiquitin-protein ligase [bacterium]